MNIKLDKEEKEIVGAFERGEFEPVDSKDNERFREYARRTLDKQRNTDLANL